MRQKTCARSYAILKPPAKLIKFMEYREWTKLKSGDVIYTLGGKHRIVIKTWGASCIETSNNCVFSAADRRNYTLKPPAKSPVERIDKQKRRHTKCIHFD